MDFLPVPSLPQSHHPLPALVSLLSAGVCQTTPVLFLSAPAGVLLFAAASVRDSPVFVAVSALFLLPFSKDAAA